MYDVLPSDCDDQGISIILFWAVWPGQWNHFDFISFGRVFAIMRLYTVDFGTYKIKNEKYMNSKNVYLNFFICIVIWTCAVYVNAQDTHPQQTRESVEHKESSAAGSKTFQLDEIVVTGDKIEAFIQQYPHQMVGMDAAEIRRRNFIDAYEALSTLPGVDIKQSSGGGTRISIRGAGGSGPVLILIDGRPINTGQYGGVDLSGIPMDMIKSIMVFKPPAPVWLGPGSSAGAICIETKTGRKGKAVKNKNRIRLSGGSYGGFGFNGSSKFNHKKSNTLLAAGYNHRDGKRKNSHKDNGRVSVNWDYKTEKATQYQINGKYSNSKHGVSGPTYNPTLHAWQKYDKGSLDFKIKGFAGKNSDYDIKLYGDILALKDYANEGDVSTLDLYKTGLSSEIVWSDVADRHDFRLGGFLEQIQVDHTFTGDHYRNTASMHIEHTLRLKRITVATGARGDYTNDYDAFPACNIGMRFEITPKIFCKSNVGYSVNLPSFGQLYQPGHGSIDQVRGNPDLVEEKIVSSSLSIEHTLSKDNVWAFAVFRTDTRDLIKYQRDDDLISRPQNINRAYKQGAEVSLKLKPTDSFALDVNYVWQQTKNEENRGELSYAPQHHGKVTVKHILAVKTRLELIARAYSSQFTDTDSTVSEKINGYATVDVRVIQPLTIFSRPVEWFVHFKNLFDREYDAHYGYPDDGFRFICGMNMNF